MKVDESRDAGLCCWKLNGMTMAWFIIYTGANESIMTQCFKGEQEALLEIGLFKYNNLYRALAKK